MNLTKLFATQAALDEHIMQEHPELRGQNNLDWKLLALQVELGECANEWRGFKKWSKDQEPRVYVPNPKDPCEECNGKGYFDTHKRLKDWIFCENCDGCGYHFYNPLLEEYVDCLHFILSIGLELGAHNWMKLNQYPVPDENGSITLQFLDVHSKTLKVGEEIIRMELEPKEIRNMFTKAFESFLQLGTILSFTQEQVEEAYYAKNKVNHERQLTGY
ncbi:dUTP diphosphatase, partial [Lysinibacillus sp. FSL W8-0992]|uniref:dUTP diphosphatase n=1 Tax=Lysinibacillus sp. FSL W8-0992 TaxID=2954643 RepID=UPI0030F9473D